MQRLLMAVLPLVTFPFVASAADLQPGESARELTTAELDSVTAGSSKGGGLVDVDLGGLLGGAADADVDVEIGLGGLLGGVDADAGVDLGGGLVADVEIGLGGRPDHGKPKH
jgi:hypothetical protein